MKKLLNTLYITNPDYYMSLEGETVTVLSDKRRLVRSLYIILKVLSLVVIWAQVQH